MTIDDESNLVTLSTPTQTPAKTTWTLLLYLTSPATGWRAWSAEQAAEARSRHGQHKQRVQREQSEHDTQMAQRAADKLADLERHSRIEDAAALERKPALVAAALARAKANKGGGR